MPVFNPAGLGGIAQLPGATGGFLVAYPFVAGPGGLDYGARQNQFRSRRCGRRAG